MAGETNYFTTKNQNIIINFDKIFNDESLNVYNVFRLAIGKKRVYAKFAKTICDDNNKILAQNKEVTQKIIYSYFTIKRAIDNELFVKLDTEKEIESHKQDAIRDFGKYKNFINFMISNLFTQDFIDIVKDYVEKHYKDPIDESKSEGYGAGTTFNNEQSKLLGVISILSKFAIPLCTHYIYVNSDKNIKVYDFMYTTFDAIFKIAVVDSNCKNLMNKLYQFVDRIVRRTEASNKVIWDRFPMYNETRESIIDDLIVKIVTTILPKFNLAHGQGMIKLIAVVARDSVGLYKIRAKNPYECYKINDNDTSADDEDKLSETDIFDMYYRPQDETIMVFNRYANDDAINVICKRNNVEISEEEFEWYKKNYKLHNFTVTLVVQVFARFFSGTNNVRSCTFDQFIKLMIILIKKMKDLNITYLPHFVTANRESYSFTRMPSAGILKALKVNPDYIDLINMKYKAIRNIFDIKTTTGDSRNPIKDMIVSLIHNDYVYNEFGGQQNGSKIPVDEERIFKDVLAVYKKMIL